MPALEISHLGKRLNGVAESGWRMIFDTTI